MAYWLHVTLEQCNKRAAVALGSSSVLERMSEVQMPDVLIPTTDGRERKKMRTALKLAGAHATTGHTPKKPEKNPYRMEIIAMNISNPLFSQVTSSPASGTHGAICSTGNISSPHLQISTATL